MSELQSAKELEEGTLRGVVEPGCDKITEAPLGWLSLRWLGGEEVAHGTCSARRIRQLVCRQMRTARKVRARRHWSLWRGFFRGADTYSLVECSTF